MTFFTPQNYIGTSVSCGKERLTSTLKKNELVLRHELINVFE